MAVALIVAAGRGERLGSGRPKALVPLAGTPMLEWSVRAMRPIKAIERIVNEFGGLEELLAATDGELETVDGIGEIRAKDIREGLRRQQEINLVDRYLQT